MATLTLKKFCSTCFDEVPKEYKHCSKKDCKYSSLCYDAVPPFQEHQESGAHSSYHNYRIDIIIIIIYHCVSDKWDQLQYPFIRKVVDGRIQDIQDGEAYLKLAEPGGFLVDSEHTGLILCSDGVQLFNS